MQSETRDPAYVWDMLDAAKTVVAILSGKTKDDWDNDIVLRMAVERGIEIIGEAARRVSKIFTRQHPEIPWSDIIGQRNILIHEYGRINHDQLYRTATQDVPKLIDRLLPLLPPVEED